MITGQWGAIGFNTGIFLGFVAAVVSSVIESVGAFHACARVSDERPPPAHAVNRGIAMEGRIIFSDIIRYSCIISGIGCLISALMGGGVGVTTYSENVGVINITKVWWLRLGELKREHSAVSINDRLTISFIASHSFFFL